MSDPNTPARSGALMNASVLHTSVHRFAAARSLSALPADHPYRAVHGHNFLAGVWATVPAGWATPGLEPRALGAALRTAVRPFDPGLLDDTLASPGDAALAEWLRDALATQVPGIELITVQSTAFQGVRHDVKRNRSLAWRRYRFEAAHQLPRVPAGHKCGRMHGHGFSVVLEADALDPAASGVQDYDRLDAAWTPWQRQLDGACLNDLEGLDNPTSEMLAAWLWDRIAPALVGLRSVTVYETASCGAHYDGTGFQIWKDFSFDSAVRLSHASVPADRTGVHGHTFLARLILSARLDEVMGWTVDYGDVKQLFQPIYQRLDHQPLHDIAALQGAGVGELTRWILDEAGKVLPALEAIAVFETPGNGAWLSRQDWRRYAILGES